MMCKSDEHQKYHLSSFPQWTPQGNCWITLSLIHQSYMDVNDKYKHHQHVQYGGWISGLLFK